MEEWEGFERGEKTSPRQSYWVCLHWAQHCRWSGGLCLNQLDFPIDRKLRFGACTRLCMCQTGSEQSSYWIKHKSLIRFSLETTDRVAGTGNPWPGQVRATAVDLVVGLTTLMSSFVNFGFALDTGSEIHKSTWFHGFLDHHRENVEDKMIAAEKHCTDDYIAMISMTLGSTSCQINPKPIRTVIDRSACQIWFCLNLDGR